MKPQPTPPPPGYEILPVGAMLQGTELVWSPEAEEWRKTGRKAGSKVQPDDVFEL